MKMALVVLAAAMAAAGCYSSTSFVGDGDAAGDRVGDPADDRRETGGEDIRETQEEPPPPTPYSIDFIVRNDSPAGCSSCVFYLDYTMWYWYSYDLDVGYGGETIAWHRPGCTEPCDAITDPDRCCIDCAAPMPAVKQLLPGESVTIHWDGKKYPTFTDVCACGCWREFTVGPAAGEAGICAYPSYTCFGGSTCTVGEDGVITMADPAGDPVCARAPFSFPADDKGTAVIRIKP